MTIIAVEPLFLADSDIQFGDDDYAAAVSSVTLTPSSSTVTFKGLKPGSVFTRQTSATWTCVINYAQDWETAGSLSNYLHANEGTSVDAVITPQDGGATVAVTIIITPGAIGGAIDTFGTTSVTLGVDGKPEITPAGGDE